MTRCRLLVLMRCISTWWRRGQWTWSRASTGVACTSDDPSPYVNTKAPARSAFMGIDMESMEALEIFSAEDHPNRHSGEKKEGFSLFRLMNRTKSGCGKKLLRSWCLRPLQSIPAIEARQEHIQRFLRDDVSKDLHKLISHVPNVKVKVALMCSYIDGIVFGIGVEEAADGLGLCQTPGLLQVRRGDCRPGSHHVLQLRPAPQGTLVLRDSSSPTC